MKETRKYIHRKMLTGSGGGEAAALCVQTYRAFYINIQVFARMNKKKTGAKRHHTKNRRRPS